MRPHHSDKQDAELELVDEVPAEESNGNDNGDTADKRDGEDDVELRDHEDGDGAGGSERRNATRQTKRVGFPTKTGDEKWESALDHKLRPLLGDVDVTEYGGRDLDE